MTSNKQILSFFENTSSIAVIGVSRNTGKMSYMVYRDLKKNGYNVVPVNKHTDTIEGDSCYKEIDKLPDNINAAIILTPPKETPDVFLQVVQKGIKNVWIQQGAHNPEVLKLVPEDTNLIYNKCMYMFAAPVKGIHKFHRSLLGLFGMLPK